MKRFLSEAIDVSEAEAIAICSAQTLNVVPAIKLAEPIEAAGHVDLRRIIEPVMGHEDEAE